ncbi:spermidine coumaroyl-CoA acyltransferase-like [Vigna umbellata]|uniref:spermidine coumaroyl-CoA acyltransferase-like n=1 Tax=Vigna umbellata TaxID=87088 RepID=UPI001F5E5DD1|nr:spermidine coumaroyl-CoA acyltransferase-like [Vigna umbellata]
MATQNTTFELVMKDVVLIKPSKPTPSSILPLSTLDNIPFNNSLCHTLHVFRSKTHDLDEPGCPNHQLLDLADVIKAAISKALFYYYPLAGRLVKHTDGNFMINCSAEGVPFLEASASCNLSSLHFWDGTDMQNAKHLVFDLPSQSESGYQYPLVFKVTTFTCGGFTIGMGMLHTIGDGIGASQILKAIIELARGKSEPSVKPVWERERLKGSITKQPLLFDSVDEASAAVSPFLPTEILVQECIKVNSESIRRLKMSLMKESGENENFTTFESLAAYVWRSKSRALKLNCDGKVKLTITVGVRRHLQDPLPEGYYGNAIVDTDVVLTVRELNERPLHEIVKLIKESKKVASNSDYVRNFINTLETEVTYFNIEGSGAYTVLTDWRYLGFLEKIDCGVKELVNTLPVASDMFGSVDLCIFSSLCNLDSSMEGGVSIFQSLPAAALLKFKEEMEALSLLI